MWGVFILTESTPLLIIQDGVYQVDDTMRVYSSPPNATFLPGSILFVGDSMLARRVESYMQMYGALFPFASTTSFIHTFDHAVGNFEGTIPAAHTQTPELTFRFSVQEAYLDTLKEAGFTMLSLANNHAYDFGSEAYGYTRARCMTTGIVCAGHPYEVSTSSVSHIRVGSSTVGILFLHATTEAPPYAVLEKYVASLCVETDVCIVYVHWGTEYALTHNVFQEKLAHILIDMGVDAVIGHHPHVVQDVGFYRGKPIFYSLGNFIFDQFFDYEVQVGMGVSVEINEDTLVYTLVPFSSLETRSQPSIATSTVRSMMLTRVLEPIKDTYGVSTTTGTITISRSE